MVHVKCMMRLANKAAQQSSYYYKLGAVIVKGNRVIESGYNKIGHCKINSFPNSRHAEMDVILKVLRKENGLSSLSNSTLYVSRITAHGTAMAKPCAKCMKLIHSVGIKEVIYTTDNNLTERLKI